MIGLGDLLSLIFFPYPYADEEGHPIIIILKSLILKYSEIDPEIWLSSANTANGKFCCRISLIIRCIIST